jgi:DNA modification methylase
MGMPVEVNGTGHQPQARVILGDCLAVLPTLPAQSFDLVFTDPPYPFVDRPYGYWTEPQWLGLMMKVVAQVRRVLKPTGSAVFVLQPNSERAGRMRGWLWEFMAWLCREWNVIQDAYWINDSTRPAGGACKAGLLRGAVKYMVWVGSPECYRNQAAVLWGESEQNRYMRLSERFYTHVSPSNHRAGTTPAFNDGRRKVCRAAARGGVTPFNFLPVGCDRWGGGAHGHAASTPTPLCSWWLRYLCPPGGSVLDPFAGMSTVGVAALLQGKSYTGIERMPEYVEISRKRLDAEAAAVPTKA